MESEEGIAIKRSLMQVVANGVVLSCDPSLLGLERGVDIKRSAQLLAGPARSGEENKMGEEDLDNRYGGPEELGYCI